MVAQRLAEDRHASALANEVGREGVPPISVPAESGRPHAANAFFSTGLMVLSLMCLARF